MTEQKAMTAKITRYLLAHTYIVRDKNEKMFRFCRNEENKRKLSAVLEQIGYYIDVDDKLGIVRLINTDDAENELAGKNENLFSFSKCEQVYLAILWQYYVEHAYEDTVTLSAKLLREKVLTFIPAAKKMTEKEALKNLKYFNLVNFKETNMDDYPITIYPTVLSIFDEEKFCKLIEAEEADANENRNADIIKHIA